LLVKQSSRQKMTSLPTRFAHLLAFLITAGTFHLLPAQSEDPWQALPSIGIHGFADVYYVYDFNTPEGSFRQDFLFNHNRHNEFNLNLGLLGLHLEHQKYRARVTLQTGTYANDNYAAEPGVLKNLFEAWAGLALNRENTLWVDAGVMPSHLGFESAISLENHTLTRSLSAENSPYFLTGLRVSYQPADYWEVAALVVNGWQRIQRLDGNSLPSFGTQVRYTPSEDFLLNWSTFIGTDDPDETRRMRYFSNLYGQFKITENLGLLAGFDLGIQQESKGSSAYDPWFTPTIIARYALQARWNTAIRLEYYQDAEGVIITTGTPNGFRTMGASWNVDYAPAPQIACRLEARWMGSRDAVFRAERDPVDNAFFVGASLAVSLERWLDGQSGE
jgi:hypothetical protein